MTRLIAAGALAALIAAMVAVAFASLGSDGNGGGSKRQAAGTTTRATVRTQPTTTTAPKPAAPIKLVAVGPYDPPPGDGTENDSQVPNAVDGNRATYWSTEHYTRGFFKRGVGIVLDAGKRRRIARVLVGTDEVGSRAEIQLADIPTGPYRIVSPDKPLTETTAFALKRGATGRYVLVWLTALPTATGEGHITEVRALSR
jgi:hypothetical protein